MQLFKYINGGTKIITGNNSKNQFSPDNGLTADPKTANIKIVNSAILNFDFAMCP